MVSINVRMPGVGVSMGGIPNRGVGVGFLNRRVVRKTTRLTHHPPLGFVDVIDVSNATEFFQQEKDVW